MTLVGAIACARAAAAWHAAATLIRFTSSRQASSRHQRGPVASAPTPARKSIYSAIRGPLACSDVGRSVRQRYSPSALDAIPLDARLGQSFGLQPRLRVGRFKIGAARARTLRRRRGLVLVGSPPSTAASPPRASGDSAKPCGRRCRAATNLTFHQPRFLLDLSGAKLDMPLPTSRIERAIGGIYSSETERTSHDYRAHLGKQPFAVSEMPARTAPSRISGPSLGACGT